MAEPQDAAIMLQDASEIVQEEYMAKYDEQYQDRFGSVTNKCFSPEPETVGGDGLNMQYEVGPADTVRTQVNPLGDITYGQNISPGKVKVRWNQSNPTLHDFIQVSARCQFDIYTIENKSVNTIVNLSERIYNSIQPDFDEKLAVLRNSDRTAQIALVDGTPRQNDSEAWSSATATPTNLTGMRLKIDSGSIAVIRPGGRYDFIRPATGAVIAGNIQCTDVPNFDEKSAGFQFNSTGPTGELSTGALGSVADNDIIVYSGMYNAGLYSFGAYFGAPTTAAFICGANRKSAGYRWMIPQRIDAGSNKISKALFNRMAIAMGFISENPNLPVAIKSDPTQHQAIRDELGEEAFIEFPTGDSRAARFMNFGTMGLNYQHPTFGTVKILADPLSLPTRIEFIVGGTWKTLSYGWKGLKILPGDGGGHWYRMNQATPNTGRGLIMAADWVGNVADFGTQPWKNGCVFGLAIPA